MTTICLIRHGETDWNALGKLQGQTDVPLNANGRKQADDCGQFLKEYDWEILISSPLKRAKETAEIINRHLHLPFTIMPEFAERSFGEAEGMTPEEREKTFPSKAYPGQETEEALRKRLMDGLDYIQKQFNDKKILLVTHGAVIHHLLHHFSNGEFGKKKIRLSNGGFNHIHFDQLEWKVRAYNQISHLS